LRKNSQADAASLLVAAISARSLAQSARRAGFVPLAVDFFADSDTQAAAHACRKLRGDIGRGFHADALLAALETLAQRAPSPVLGLVYGAGFEDRPHLLRLAAERWPILGNDAATIESIKAPARFFAALDRLRIAHPAISMTRPERTTGWLAKKIGGAGGSHILPARLAGRKSGFYYQEQVAGRPVSALFVGNGTEARVLGFSEQWTAPSRRGLWRYGGAVRPAALAAGTARQMVAAVKRVTGEFGLKGLGSADFLVDGETALLLEVNPRPGATLDIFDAGATPLLELHLCAIREGELPPRVLRLEGAMASAIVYAKRGGAAPPGMVWPAWTADRPGRSEWIDKDRPICTVLARSGTTSQAKRLIKERICRITNWYLSVGRGDEREQKRRNRRRASEAVAKRQRQGGAARQSLDR
jgi:predicted ATP-grasp superfamily ATP-dependent carboligase